MVTWSAAEAGEVLPARSRARTVKEWAVAAASPVTVALVVVEVATFVVPR